MSERDPAKADGGGLELTIERVVAAPRAAIWRCWTDPRLLARWWAPAPYRTEVLEFDARAGGRFRTVMRGPDGVEHDGDGVFLEMIPQRRIAFTDALVAGWRPAPEPFFSAVVTMEDHAGGTLYRALALHATEANRRRHEAMGFHDGWGAVIGQLEATAAAIARGEDPPEF